MGLRGHHYRDRHWPREYVPVPYEYRPPVGYFASVRHPWISLIVLLPLLAGYELGVRKLSGQGGSIRAGVELWLMHWLEQSGQAIPFLIPASLVGLLLLWCLIRWGDRPDQFIIPTLGTLFEGVACGIGLWALCLNAPALMQHAGLPVAAMDVSVPQVVTYLGVGLYEEAIFRLIGFGILARTLRIMFVPGVAAIPAAMLFSAAAFALAHHFVQSDPFIPVIFFTRMLIGLCCAILFWLRGLGVAVGAHIVYDVIVSANLVP